MKKNVYFFDLNWKRKLCLQFENIYERLKRTTLTYIHNQWRLQSNVYHHIRWAIHENFANGVITRFRRFLIWRWCCFECFGGSLVILKNFWINLVTFKFCRTSLSPYSILPTTIGSGWSMGNASRAQRIPEVGYSNPFVEILIANSTFI